MHMHTHELPSSVSQEHAGLPSDRKINPCAYTKSGAEELDTQSLCTLDEHACARACMHTHTRDGPVWKGVSPYS